MNIGLIAGGGQFPILFSKRAREKGYRVIAAGFHSETLPELGNDVDEFQWLYLGQVSKLLRFFRRHGVSQAVMLGAIRKTNLFRDIRPDFKALAFIGKTTLTHDDSVLSGFADLMAKEGVEILPSTFLLPELICQTGCWTQRKPAKAEQADIKEGWRIAGDIGRLDIGQCLVISNGTVLAVEAVDGTDETILRGGRLSRKKGCVVIKRSKPIQDLRFDLPSSGVQTISTMHEAGASTLVLEAGKSIVFDREEMISLADRYQISIVGYTDSGPI